MISNKFKKKAIVLAIAIFIMLIIPVSFAGENIGINQTQELSLNDEATTDDASQIYVDANSGKSNGTGSADDPVQTISQGLNLSKNGGTIYLTGEFTGEGNLNLTFDGNTDEITFIGRNAVINGNHSNTFVRITNGTYYFNNISFINHYKLADEIEFGGAVYNEGKVTFEECTFDNNVISGVNRANGGAIDNTGTLIIRNCLFTNNTADVSNSSGFRKNAADGGAVSNLGKLRIYETRFIENKAMRNGGAIRTQDGATNYIENCEFIGNVAAYHLSGGSFGGAVYTWDCELNLFNSTFKNNKIYDQSGYGAQGGAISSDRGSGIINIKNCEFINNTADGVGTVNGQSIYIGAVTANINYCTIDTPVYSISQSSDFNYNWWDVNDGNIGKLIENLPPNAKVKTFAEATITSDTQELKIGEKVEITIKICWNGTNDQSFINLIPTRSVNLDSNCGELSDAGGKLTNGLFSTILTVNNTKNPLITAKIDDVSVKYNFTKGDVETELNVTCEEIFEGETSIITIASNKELTGICLIDIGDGKYYVELTKGRATTGISNLKAGKYDVLVKYLNEDGINNSTALTVNEKLNPNMNVTIVQNNENATVYVDLENATTGNLSMTVDGNPVSILNSTITDLSCGNHKIEVIFSGDKKYKPATYGETITVKPLDTKIVAVSSFTCIASDINAGEKGGSITIGLTDVKGNPLSNKTLQVALNCKIYNLTTGENGQTILDVSMQNAKVYTCAITFAGDETYNASPLTVTKLTVNKKKTTISASAKTFKVKTKSKTISVTLKTVKNKYDGKTYLYKGKKLTLTVNGKTYTAKTNAKGVAKFSLKLAKKGKFTAKVKFAGDATYKASNKKIKITIK